MSEPSPTVLIVETTAGDPPVEFLGPSSDLVYFLSMAHSERYGASHDLARAGFVVKRRLRINMNPLLNFGDAQPDDAGEAAMMDKLWQDPGPVAEAALAIADAIADDEELRELTSAFPELPDRLREFAEMAHWASEQGAQIRLTYVI
ncbi:MAG: hypothetical protein ABIP58_02080 [Dehalococcoidia bacterium]